MARTITQIEAVWMPFGSDGIFAVGSDGTAWGSYNSWQAALNWVQSPPLPGGRLIQSVKVTPGWASFNVYALATDGTLWGCQNITLPNAFWIQGGNIPQT
jgi:hypothetical protein